MVSKWSLSNSVISSTFAGQLYTGRIKLPLFPSLFVSVWSHGFLFDSIGYSPLLLLSILTLSYSSSVWPVEAPSSWFLHPLRHVLLFLWALLYFLAQEDTEFLPEGGCSLFFFLMYKILFVRSLALCLVQSKCWLLLISLLLRWCASPWQTLRPPDLFLGAVDGQAPPEHSWVSWKHAVSVFFWYPDPYLTMIQSSGLVPREV